jgi:hypothetical protein
MKVIVKLDANGDGKCVVTREAGDPRFHGIAHAKGEHRLLEHVKRVLNKDGADFIKKRAQKDGHMIGDDYQPYLRERNAKDGRQLAIYNGFYALRGANEDFNTKGEVHLIVSNLGAK